MRIPYSGRLPKSHNFSWDAFHSLEEIEGLIDYLRSAYSSIISIVHIGRSYEGRDMRVVCLCSSGTCGRKTAIWVDAGIHAREWLAVSSITYMMNELVKDPSSTIVTQLDWYFLPVVNPDGFVYSHTHDRQWRKTRSVLENTTCRGVDLNRNFGFQWEVRLNACSPTYSGPKPFSEVEIRNMRDFIIPRKDRIKEVLSLHSFGKIIVYPWAHGKQKFPKKSRHAKMGKTGVAALFKVRKTVYRFGSANKYVYSAPGTSLDYFYGAVNTPVSFIVEAGNTFDPNNNEILPVAKEIHAFQVVVAKRILNKYPNTGFT